MKMYSRDGIEMMEVKSIYRDGDNLALKGKMMGSMNTVIHIRPEDTWMALRMLSLLVFLYLPVMVLKGMWRSRRSASRSIPP